MPVLDTRTTQTRITFRRLNPSLRGPSTIRVPGNPHSHTLQTINRTRGTRRPNHGTNLKLKQISSKVQPTLQEKEFQVRSTCPVLRTFSFKKTSLNSRYVAGTDDRKPRDSLCERGHIRRFIEYHGRYDHRTNPDERVPA